MVPGTFEFQPTFDSVTILNYSPLPLLLEGVDVANLRRHRPPSPSPSTIVSTYDRHVNLTTAAALFTPTFVVIENVAGVANSNITIDGVIYNPIGTTFLDNERGDIVAGINLHPLGGDQRPRRLRRRRLHRLAHR